MDGQLRRAATGEVGAPALVVNHGHPIAVRLGMPCPCHVGPGNGWVSGTSTPNRTVAAAAPTAAPTDTSSSEGDCSGELLAQTEVPGGPVTELIPPELLRSWDCPNDDTWEDPMHEEGVVYNVECTTPYPVPGAPQQASGLASTSFATTSNTTPSSLAHAIAPLPQPTQLVTYHHRVKAVVADMDQGAKGWVPPPTYPSNRTGL